MYGITTWKEVSRHGQAVKVRPLTFSEMQRMQKMKPDELIRMVCPDADVDNLNVPLILAAVAEIQALTFGTDALSGNSESTGAATPPSAVSTAMTIAAGSTPPAPTV